MERIFYKTGLYDSSVNLPIYMFDTSYLPSTKVIEYDEFILALMQNLPREQYVLIMFSCGLNKVSWVWGIKFLKEFLGNPVSSHLDQLVKIITVHDSWFVKSITQIFKNYSITRKNFSLLNKIIDSFNLRIENFGMANATGSSIIQCKTLSELNKHIDITKVKISLNVYKYNSQIEADIQVPQVKSLITNETRIDQGNCPDFYHHFYQIFNILNTYGDKSGLVFHRPGNKLNTELLFKCIKRNQLFWINDWDIFCIGTTFKKILMELPEPIISIRSIDIPVKDDIQSTKRNLDKILHSYDKESNYYQVLLQLFEMCHKLLQNEDVTKHSSSTLSKCLSHCLSKELVLLHNNNILVVNRFLKNVLDNWENLRRLYVHSFPSVREIIDGQADDGFMDSYDLSHEVTLEEDDGKEIVSFNTHTILTNNTHLSTNDGVDLAKQPRKSPRRKHAAPSSPNRRPLRSPERKQSSPSKREGLSDISNLSIQYPPQKYKFNIQKSTKHKEELELEQECLSEPRLSKKPVIRGRRVGELARVFEERAEGLDILKQM